MTGLGALILYWLSAGLALGVMASGLVKFERRPDYASEPEVTGVDNE